jgi:hypothetical protein
MTTTDTNEWTYMFSIVRASREAEIYINNGLDENFRVVCKLKDDPEVIVEDEALDYCREVGEDYVMER